MKKINIGIVDYDLGNHDSLFFFLKSLGFKVVISKDFSILSGVDLIALPGVGAFPKAMKSLSESGIINFLTQWSTQGNPLLGICLGMQLLGSVSYEFGETKGLGLIPGEIVPLDSGKWHIGWNDHVPYKGNDLFGISTKDQFYYNHSFKFSGNEQAIMSYSMFDELIPAIIKKNNTVGIQFHPEKSQKSGQKLILRIVESLVNG
jgi:imidazole glycerol phosphate synthase glutamine amidotransferase subunit